MWKLWLVSLFGIILSGCGTFGNKYHEPNPSQTAVEGAAYASQPQSVRSPEIVTQNTTPSTAFADTSFYRIVQCNENAKSDNTGKDEGMPVKAVPDNCNSRNWEATVMTGKNGDLRELHLQAEEGKIKQIDVGSVAGTVAGDRGEIATTQAGVEEKRQETAQKTVEQGPPNQEAVDAGSGTSDNGSTQP